MRYPRRHIGFCRLYCSYFSLRQESQIFPTAVLFLLLPMLQTESRSMLTRFMKALGTPAKTDMPNNVLKYPQLCFLRDMLVQTSSSEMHSKFVLSNTGSRSRQSADKARSESRTASISKEVTSQPSIIFLEQAEQATYPRSIPAAELKPGLFNPNGPKSAKENSDFAGRKERYCLLSNSAKS
jgi:hypothetical protein